MILRAGAAPLGGHINPNVERIAPATPWVVLFASHLRISRFTRCLAFSFGLDSSHEKSKILPLFNIAYN